MRDHGRAGAEEGTRASARCRACALGPTVGKAPFLQRMLALKDGPRAFAPAYWPPERVLFICFSGTNLSARRRSCALAHQSPYFRAKGWQ